MKWSALLLGALLALFGTNALAQSTAQPVINGYLTLSGCQPGYTSCFQQYGPSGASPAPYVLTSTGFQQVASFSTSTGFTPPAGSTICYIQAEGNSVRFRTDGVAPTATVGQLLAVGALLAETASLSTIKFIPTTGNATLDVDCYR